MTTPPKPKPFRQAAEAYCADKLKAWVRDTVGTPMEEAALTYARREGWILPSGEGLEAVTALNLFYMVDIVSSVEAIKHGTVTEIQAKKDIAAAVLDGFREAEAGINALRFPASQEAIPGPGTKDCATDGVPAPGIASCEPVMGIPEGIASATLRFHVFEVGDVQFYTADRATIEYVQAAQAQNVTVAVQWVEGEHGKRAVKVGLV